MRVAAEVGLYGAARDRLAEQLLDRRVNITHSELAVRLLKDSHDRVSNGTELASAVWRNARRRRLPWNCLLPFRKHETLKEAAVSWFERRPTRSIRKACRERMEAPL